MRNTGGLRIAPWWSDKRFAYSITYDDGLVETAGAAWQIHRQYEIPGHVNILLDKIGKLEGDTSAGFLQSLWNLQKYMDVDTVQFLRSEGWQFGCQLPSGETSPTSDGMASLRLSLAEAIDAPVPSIAVSAPDTLVACQHIAQEAGFQWILAIHDALNNVDADSSIIRRSPLYHRGPAPILLANDPFRLLGLARDRRGWVVDVVRLVDRFPLNPARDCTPAELTARFEALRKIGDDDVWIAPPETIASYRSWRHTLKCVEVNTDCADKLSWRVESGGALCGTLCPELTYVVSLPMDWNVPAISVDGCAVSVFRGKDARTWQFNHRARHPQNVEVVAENRSLV